jgi:hypothetical protein
MKRLLLFLLPTCLLARGPSEKALNTISPAAAKNIVDFLSSDSSRGRYTPSPELERCADYLATLFQASGLQPVNGSYFQEIHMNRTYLNDTNFVTLVAKDGLERKLEIKKEYMPFETTADKQASGEIIFVGYGICAPENNYDDYKGVDVTGKIVLALKGGPNENNQDSPFSTKKMPPSAKLSEKVRVAIDHGAEGFMLVTNPLRSGLLKPTGFPWPNFFKGFPTDAVPLSLVQVEKKKIPCVQIGEEALIFLFGSVDSCKALAQSIDSLYKPHSFVLAPKRAIIRTSTFVRTQTARNVVAILPGSDAKLKEDWLIVGGHYDHIGIKKNTPAGQDSINNGADDNASGTAGVMMVAAAFATEKQHPKRSLLFMAFAGEELGLYGSETYVADPLLPLEKTIAMINLDMIGRNRVDSLTIIGRHNAPELWAMAAKENKHINFKLSSGSKRDYGGSDHMPFIKKKIPTLFFHTGLHADYHQVGDQTEKVNYGKLALATKLCYRTVWKLANSSFRPILHDEKGK